VCVCERESVCERVCVRERERSFEILGPISRNVDFYDMGGHHKLVTFKCPKDSNKTEYIHANF